MHIDLVVLISSAKAALGIADAQGPGRSSTSRRLQTRIARCGRFTQRQLGEGCLRVRGLRRQRCLDLALGVHGDRASPAREEWRHQPRRVRCRQGRCRLAEAAYSAAALNRGRRVNNTTYGSHPAPYPRLSSRVRALGGLDALACLSCCRVDFSSPRFDNASHDGVGQLVVCRIVDAPAGGLEVSQRF